MKKMDLSLIFQLSITTSDMEDTLSNWRRYFRLNEDSIIRKSTKEIFDRGEYHCNNFLEKEVEFYHKYYRFDLGELDMELIEPITKDNSNPYTDFLSHGKNGLQHLGVKIVNRPDLIANMKKIGVPVYTYAYMGPEEADNEKRADCYFYDLRSQLGVVIEAGGAVVGPLATDPRAGNQELLDLLNSFAVYPELPSIEEVAGLEKTEIIQLYQIAVVVSNVAATMNNWVKFFGIDQQTVIWGGEEAVCRFCMFEVGGIVMKIIEPIGEGIYRDFYEQSGGNNIMYIGATMTDRDIFVSNMDKVGIKPLACLNDGTGDPTDSDAYIYDLRDGFGLILKASR